MAATGKKTPAKKAVFVSMCVVILYLCVYVADVPDSKPKNSHPQMDNIETLTIVLTGERALS